VGVELYANLRYHILNTVLVSQFSPDIDHGESVTLPHDSKDNGAGMKSSNSTGATNTTIGGSRNDFIDEILFIVQK
jgi:hypothetical protein